MFSNTTRIAASSAKILPVLATLLLCLTIQAQSTQSRLDGYTPTELEQGAPTGSYPLSGFESINNYNGNLNVALPLLRIGGRGSAGHTITLPISNKWEVIRGSDSQGIADDTIFRAGDVWQVGYSPGMLIGTSVMNSPAGTTTCPPSTFRQFLTRLRFIMPDGTEAQLFDKKYQGATQSVNVSCVPTTPNRGKVFVTDDGESMTFISDTDILDQPAYVGGPYDFYPSGVLLMKDGTRYRIDSGKVSWIRDRNGNKVTYTYEAGTAPWRNLLSATDSLNRQVSITYATTVSGYDEITYKGFGGATRSLKVWYNTLANILRSGSTLQKFNQLFPEIYSYSLYSGDYNFSPALVAKVELPDQRTYQFYYNSYGEVARIILPTGGGFDYEYAGGAFGVNDVSHLPTISRRCTTRKVFNTLTATTSPTAPPSGTLEQLENYVIETGQYSGSGNTTVRVEHRDAANVLLTQEKHYYYGAPYEYLNNSGEPTLYSIWSSGKEYKSESYNVTGGVAGSVLRKSENTWSPSVSNPYPILNLLPAPNPTIVETINTLADTNQVSRQTFSYDQYNNQTDVYDYDLGNGTYGALVRRAHTDYLTSGYDTIVGGITTPNPTATIHIRNLPTQSIVYDASNNQKALTTFEYDNYSATANHASLVNRTNISGLDSTATTSFTMRGNLTANTRYANAASSSGTVTTYLQYDIAGNVIATIDANGNATTFDYSDHFGAPDGEARANTAPAIWLNGQTTFAFPTLVTNAKGHTTFTQFDYYLGKPVDIEDPNGIKGSLYYNDALDRPTQARRNVTSATAYYSQTTIAYDDTNHVITVSADKTAVNDNVIISKALYDGIGRTWRKASYENADTTKPWLITETQFDALGRAYRTTNPFRAAAVTTGLANPEWTTSTFDALSRITTVTSPDTAVVQTQYNGNVVTVIDQAKKVRRSITDGLGRLVRVDEPTRDFTNTEANQSPLNPDLLLGSVSSPNQPTSYTYDALDDLLTIIQGAQTRTFAYDSLKRMTSADSPEWGTITNNVRTNYLTTYEYDNNGNLKKKTDGLGRWVQYNYDQLNRNYETYSNDSQTVYALHIYDGATNGKGKLWYTMTSSYYVGGSNGGQYLDNTTFDTYDALGRPTSYRQNFRINNDTAWSSSYTTTRTYDLAGNVLSQTYPSGRTVNYAYNTAGQMTTFNGNLGDSTQRDYATNMTYNPRGQMMRETFGTTTALYHRMYYNKRGQMFDTRLGTDGSAAYDVENPATWRWAAGTWNRGAIRLYYSSTQNDYDDYGTSGGALANNNGNVYRMDHFVPDNDAVSTYKMSTDTYTYDALNRLSAVKEKQDTNGTGIDAFQQANLYDRWGNRTIDNLNTWAKDGTVWADDSVPAGAVAVGDTDGWNWVTASPTAFSGSSSHQSANIAGLHQHYFYGATATLTPSGGESLYAWVYLDPTNTPTEVMLQWNDGSWEHRAYWGANNITYWGTDGTDSRRYMGALPAKGGWVRLEVPASAVGLVGHTINGMAFTLTDGKATWDRAGKTALPGGGINNTKYTVQTDANNIPTNRLQTTGNCMLYDAVGNLINDCGKTRSYDANNKMRSAVDGTVTTGYRYDADGHRTVKSVGSTLTWFIYGIGGELLAEYPANGATNMPQIEYGYRGSELLIEGGCDAVHWKVSDQLGSTRMSIGTAGTLASVKRTDYLPFGEEIGAGVGIRSTAQGYSQADCWRQKFTGYEKDTETGLDYAQARYYANLQGRFTSVDPVMVAKNRLLDPQAINLYAYVRNNSLRLIDPSGQEFRGTDGERVDIAEEDGQFIIKSANASKDLIRLVGLINKSKSKSAMSQFRRATAHKTMLTVIFAGVAVNENGKADPGLLGLHQPHGVRADGTPGALAFKDGKFEGEAFYTKDSKGQDVYTEATITIYEESIKAGSVKDKQAAEDYMVGTFGHEAQHDLDPAQVQETKMHTYRNSVYHAMNSDKSPKEGSPYWYTFQIIKEIQEARKKRK